MLDNNSAVAQAVAKGSSSDAGTLTGAEFVPLSRGAGLLQTTLTKIATFAIQTFQGFTQSGTGAVARTVQSKLADGGPTLLDFMLPAMRADALSGAPSQDHTTAVQAAFNSGVPTLNVPSGAVFQLTGPLTITSKMRLTGNGELRFVSGITGSAAITVSADYCEFDGVFVTNPNLLQEQTGNRMSAITFLANYGKVVNSTVQYFQHGVIVESTGEYHDFIISNNKILDCIGAGDGPSNTTSGNGEDRGDGITVWGCCATITGNLVTAKAGQDCRIGIHMEGMPTYHADSYPLEENLGTISGNVVRGSFRRSIVLEQVNNVTVSANTCQGATWWGIAVIKAIACTINGNTILYTRASTDQTGGSWSPIHAGVNLYGGCINCVVNANTIDTSRGFADTGIYLQGLNSDSQVQGTQAATSTGTATLTLSAVNPVIDVGQLVTGTGVPAGTYVLSVIGTTLYLSNAVTAGTPTLTFTTHDRGVGNVVTNNTVLCNGGQTQSGIWAQYQDYPVINNNGVRNPTTYGVTGYDIAYPVINGNNLAGFKGVNYGIQLVSNTTAVVINGNLISGFTVAGAVGIGVQNRVGGVISGNFVTGSPTDIDLWACTQMVVTSNNSVGATTHYSNGTGTGMTLANNTYS